MNLEDPKLEVTFLASLIDLSLTDIVEAKKFVEAKSATETDFARADNWAGYRGIVKCIGLGIPCTPDNLAREIVSERRAVIASSLASADGSGFSLDGYYDRLLEISERRQSLRLLEDARARLLEGSERASAVKFRLHNSLSRTRGRIATKGLDEYVTEVEEHITNVRNGKVKPVIPTYMPKLDAEIGGWQPTLILIGAEPGVGKSALIASGVNLQAVNGHKPFVASLEDGPEWLAYRIVSKDSGINQTDLRFTKLGNVAFEKIKLKNEIDREIRKNIRIIDGSVSGMRIEDLISSINDAIVNDGCDSVWIDHLGEILLFSSERTDIEIARHLSLLRGIANKHGVPVIVAAHFKRPADPTMPPSFRDFANSSGAERKARIALGLRREPGSDTLDVHIMKQTNGPAGGVVHLEFGGAAAMVIETEGRRA